MYEKLYTCIIKCSELWPSASFNMLKLYLTSSFPVSVLYFIQLGWILPNVEITRNSYGQGFQKAVDLEWTDDHLLSGEKNAAHKKI